MGKKDKEHRKKVAARNQKIKGAQRAYEKMYNEQMKKYLEDLRTKYESTTGETAETSSFVMSGQ
jgi:DNA-binding FrmR family transcriptional regulator